MIKEQGTNTEYVEDYKRYELLRVGQWMLILIIFLLYTMIYVTSVVFDDFLRLKGCTNNTIRLPLIVLGDIDKDALQSAINKLFHPELCEIMKNVTGDMSPDDVQKLIDEYNNNKNKSESSGEKKSKRNGMKNPESVDDENQTEQNEPHFTFLDFENIRSARKAPKYLEDKNCTEVEMLEKIGRCIKLNLSDAALVYLGIFTMFLITTVDIISRVIDEPINKFPMTLLLLLSIFFSLTNVYVTVMTKFSIFHPLLTCFITLNLVLFGFFATGFLKTFCSFCFRRKRKRRLVW